MTRSISSIKKYLFPNKKINFTIIFIFSLGVIFGTIFLCMLNMNDKSYIITKITSFISSINSNNLDYSALFSNSVFINAIYLFLLFIFGFTIIGLLLVFGIVFLKGFVLGFYFGSFILTYSYKGIFLSLLYLLFVQGLNIIVIFIMSILSSMFSIFLFKTLFYKLTINYKKYIRNYFLIFILMIIISLISSLLEVFVFPALARLFIKLFV